MITFPVGDLLSPNLILMSVCVFVGPFFTCKDGRRDLVGLAGPWNADEMKNKARADKRPRNLIG